mmetsp:Transcript_33951/g.54629  ORF Transcript_33951/g.54629 Transcript_33951/m.54629 type:complete len:174 (-) Transcript_33951:487-1008(-)
MRDAAGLSQRRIRMKGMEGFVPSSSGPETKASEPPVQASSPPNQRKMRRMLLHRPRHSLARDDDKRQDMFLVTLPSRNSPVTLGYTDIPLLGEDSKGNNNDDNDENLSQSAVIFIDRQGSKAKKAAYLFLGISLVMALLAAIGATSGNIVARCFLHLSLFFLGGKCRRKKLNV